MEGDAATSAPAVTVVVPVHNEADNIGPLLAEIGAALEGRTEYEVVVVDDGSTDETPRVLQESLSRYPRLRSLRHLRNSGQSAAIATGVREARARWIVTLDGDCQNDPADVPALLARLDEAAPEGQPAMVAGWRVKRRDPWIKRASSRIANSVRGRILNDHTPDAGCGLKVFRRDVFVRLPHFDHMHRFLPALFQRAGEKVISVPVSHRPRTRGRSHYAVHDRLWVGIIDMLGVVWLGKSMKSTRVADRGGGTRAGADQDPATPAPGPSVRRPRWPFVLAWSVVAASVFIGFGSLPLMDPDEGRNAGVAREMREARSFLVPLYNGMPYLDKPTFYFGAVAASLAVLGDTEIAARLPSAFFGVLTLVIAWKFCRHFYGERTAAIAVVVIATSPLFIGLSRVVIFDVALTSLVWASLLAGYVALESAGQPGAGKWYSLSALAAAMATLVKGPVGFLLPLLGLLAYARIRKVRGGRAFFSPLNLLIFFIPVLGWFVALSLRMPDFAYYGLVKESLTRFVASGEFRRGEAVFYYVPIIAAGFLPWSVLLPEMLIRGWRQRTTASRADAMLAIFATVVVIVFTVSRSKLPAYVLPAIISLGVLTARVLGAAIDRPAGAAAGVVRRGTVFLMVTCAAAGGLLAAHQLSLVSLEALFNRGDGGFERVQVLLVPLMVCFLGIALAAALARASRRIPAMLAAFALPPFFLMVLASGHLGAYAEARSSRPLAEAVQRLNLSGAEVVCYQCFPAGLGFYLGHPITVISRDGHEIRSNYIESRLKKTSPWPQQMVRLEAADAWIASRTEPVFVLSRGTSADPWVASVATARGAELQPLAPGWWGGLIPPPGGR